MEGGRDDGITQALRCLAAMQGQDEETRASLWRAACKYAARDRAIRTEGERLFRPAASAPGVRRGTLAHEA